MDTENRDCQAMEEEGKWKIWNFWGEVMEMFWKWIEVKAAQNCEYTQTTQEVK